MPSDKKSSIDIICESLWDAIHDIKNASDSLLQLSNARQGDGLVDSLTDDRYSSLEKAQKYILMLTELIAPSIPEENHDDGSAFIEGELNDVKGEGPEEDKDAAETN